MNNTLKLQSPVFATTLAFRPAVTETAPAATTAEQDTFASEQPQADATPTHQQMLALMARGASKGSAAPPSKVLIQPFDDGMVGGQADPAKLAVSPVHSDNPQVQNYLNVLYSTKAGKAKLDELSKKSPTTKVIVGWPDGENPADSGTGGEKQEHLLESRQQENVADNMRLDVQRELNMKKSGG